MRISAELRFLQKGRLEWSRSYWRASENRDGKCRPWAFVREVIEEITFERKCEWKLVMDFLLGLRIGSIKNNDERTIVCSDFSFIYT